VVLSRRSFLGHSAGFGALAAFAAGPQLTDALADETSSVTSHPTAGELYWKNLYAGTAERGRNGMPNEDREVRIAQYNEKTGLRWAEDISVSELPSFEEDAVLTMELTGFRAGNQDKPELTKVRFAQLHLSCQRVTGSEFLGPIVWAALATMFTNKASKIPSEQNLSWSSFTGNQEDQTQATGSPQLTHVVLNNGAGHMSVNITTTPVTSVLDKVLGVMINGTRFLTPLLGFPGIALPALQSFYAFYGQLEQSKPQNFLLNSAQKDVAVTQQGANYDLISVNALRLVAGTYILIPKSQEDDFQKEMDKLVVVGGYLEESASKASPDDRVAEAVPAVTYAALNVRVQRASTFPATSTVTDPLLDSTQQGSDSSNGKSGSGKKPK
jgi:hypothetical protein